MEQRGLIQIPRSVAEAVTAVVILLAIIFLFINSLSLPPSPMRGYPGPAFIPQMILGFTGLFTVLWLGRIYIAYRRTQANALEQPAMAEENRVTLEYGGFFITIAAVAFLVFGLDHIGFEITCTAVMLALLYPRLDSLAMTVFGAVATTATIYVVFVLILGVSIPLAFLPSYISF